MMIFKRFLHAEARERLYLAYLAMSVIFVLFFSILFLFLGYYIAATIQVMVLLPFCYSILKYVKGSVLQSKSYAIASSLIIVLIQNNIVFTPSVGFRFMLIPLLVVQFLISDISDSKQKRTTFFYGFLIVAIFFISDSLFVSKPVTETDPAMHAIFFNISMVSSFIALFIMLYVYSMQLSIKEKALSYYADYDALTDIYNRGYFNRYGEQWFPLYKNKSPKLATIIFDIDDFKIINDTYGHPVGDKVLVELAKSVKKELPQNAIFSRYGGEEFAILIRDTSLKEGYDISENIRKTIEQLRVEHHNQLLHCTVSVGLAIASDYHTSFDDVVRDADRALYQSKRKGKNMTWVTSISSSDAKHLRN
jgi:diguanylate cyclase (GGDEF)-like protein